MFLKSNSPSGVILKEMVLKEILTMSMLCSDLPRYQSLLKDFNMNSNTQNYLSYSVHSEFLNYVTATSEAGQYNFSAGEFKTPDHITNSCSFSNRLVLQLAIFLVRQRVLWNKELERGKLSYLVVCVCWAIETTVIAAGTEGRLMRESCSEI